MDNNNPTTTSLIPLADAAAKFGVTDLTTFKKSLNRIGALVPVAGIDFVNTDRLVKAAIDKAEKIENRIVTRSSRKKGERNPGQMIGLIKARLGRAPTLIANKDKAIKAAELTLKDAKNAYDKSKAQTMLSVLQAGLKKLLSQQKEDTAALEAILNPTDAA